MTRAPAERFWPKVNRDGPVPEYAPHLGPCWIWTAAPDGNGYGAFWSGPGRVVKAYRWAWEAEHGPVPDGLELDHLCRVTLCVRPSHLEAVTHAENMARSVRPPVAFCPAGHDQAEHGYVDSAGARRCRPCKQQTSREASRRWRERQLATSR